ncbi:MAG: hypothetical protein JOZ13_07125 [Alphaproteobacteria bacterium]|nr:hypothetical protein [Alphaproteobacteria bacterium]
MHTNLRPTCLAIAFSLAFGMQSRADDHIRFDAQTLHPYPYGQLLADFSNDLDVGTRFVFNQDKMKALPGGIELRIFSIQPSDQLIQAGHADQARPRSWADIAHCHVYLSLVFRPNRARQEYVRSHGELTIGPLRTDAQWFPFLDKDSVAHGYYLIVFQPITKSDPPTIDNYGGRDKDEMYYEFIRLSDERGEDEKYFGNAKFFEIEAPYNGGHGHEPDLARGQRTFDAAATKIDFVDAATSIKHWLRCYSSKDVIPDTPTVSANSPAIAQNSCTEADSPRTAHPAAKTFSLPG